MKKSDVILFSIFFILLFVMIGMIVLCISETFQAQALVYRIIGCVGSHILTAFTVVWVALFMHIIDWED